jgi:hypothetical protein
MECPGRLRQTVNHDKRIHSLVVIDNGGIFILIYHSVAAAKALTNKFVIKIKWIPEKH